jgi:hypothetical protein
MVRMLRPLHLSGHDDLIQPYKEFRIELGDVPPPLDPLSQVSQLHPQDRCLDLVQTAVAATHHMDVLALLSMIPEQSDFGGQR